MWRLKKSEIEKHKMKGESFNMQTQRDEKIKMDRCRDWRGDRDLEMVERKMEGEEKECRQLLKGVMLKAGLFVLLSPSRLPAKILYLFVCF